MHIKSSPKLPIVFAVLAAACYGVSSPVSKMLLVKTPPALMAALLYLGAGMGMGAITLLRSVKSIEHREAKMTKKGASLYIGHDCA